MADIQALIERLRWADRHRIQAARGRRIFREAADELTRLSARVEELELGLGAHIQADAYRDTLPDDDEDARYLSKQETFWRLKARHWVCDETRHTAAETAKQRAIAEDPVLQKELQRMTAAISSTGGDNG